MKSEEGYEQEMIFTWAALHAAKYPELDLMHHIPNGGRRDKRTGAILKRQGVKAGIPDIFLPAAHGGYHGLYIELKTKTGSLSSAQRQILSKLNERGYKAVMCRGYEDAVETIRAYLEENDEN